ncbi:MAG TPA: VanZ family protein [Acidimicrobiia bacterium]|nr:VanZ family protein [Acidimicrobiia bacterium]
MRGTISGWTALGWAIAYVAIGLIEDLPGGDTLGLAGWFDGLAHLGATALLAALIMVWRGAVEAGENRATTRWWAWGASVAVGVAIEVLQTRVPGRAFEWGDLVADVVGAALGVAAYALAARIRGRERLIVGGGVAAIAAAGLYLLVAVVGT